MATESTEISKNEEEIRTVSIQKVRATADASRKRNLLARNRHVSFDGKSVKSRD